MNDTVTRCYGCFEPGGEHGKCTQCGYDQSIQRSPLFLPHGTCLEGQYLIGKVLGDPGGFGITYLGWDLNLQLKVAIKEYLPKNLAGRASSGLGISVHSASDVEPFETGREKFLAEARTIARFRHTNIVAVRQFFTANNTAYIVMDYYEGETLAEYLRYTESKLPAGAAIALLRPILNGLSVVHDRGMLHRDVKPANIYLASIGQPILIDFSAARFATGFRSQSLSVVLTEGYAPIEQYQRKGNQGPWTDVYGAAATLYRMMTGQAPPIAVDRINNDPLRNLIEEMPHAPPVAEVLSRALAVRPADRTPSAEVFLHQLDRAKEYLVAHGAKIQMLADDDPSVRINRLAGGAADDLAISSRHITTLTDYAIAPHRAGLAWVPIVSLVLAIVIIVLVLLGLPDTDTLELPTAPQTQPATPAPAPVSEPDPGSG